MVAVSNAVAVAIQGAIAVDGLHSCSLSRWGRGVVEVVALVVAVAVEVEVVALVIVESINDRMRAPTDG